MNKTIGTIYTELYTKETDTHNYLHYTSAHPQHCMKGAPYSEFLRIRRNCHHIADFELYSAKRIEDYLRRGYPIDELVMAQTRARNANRKDLLEPKIKHKGNNDRVPLILIYNPANPNMNQIINQKIGTSYRCLKTKMPSRRNLTWYTEGTKNLADNMIGAKCQYPPVINTFPEKRQITCKTPWRCDFCPKKQDQARFRSSVTKREYTRPSAYNCNTENVVYLITCTLCGMQYVGETYRFFRKRILEHLGYIRRKEYDNATGKHFNLPGHSSQHFKSEVIQIMKNKCVPHDPTRLSKEDKWIEQLKTRERNGLNDRYK